MSRSSATSEIRNMPANFYLLYTGRVDENQWYVVSLSKDAGRWVSDNFRKEEGKLWKHVGTNIRELHEKIYILLTLRWA
jgi:hypothetical protein